jgi:hypothetical protein
MSEFFLSSLFWASSILLVFGVVLVIADWWIMHQEIQRWEDDD